MEASDLPRTPVSLSPGHSGATAQVTDLGDHGQGERVFDVLDTGQYPDWLSIAGLLRQRRYRLAASRQDLVRAFERAHQARAIDLQPPGHASTRPASRTSALASASLVSAMPFSGLSGGNASIKFAVNRNAFAGPRAIARASAQVWLDPVPAT